MIDFSPIKNKEKTWEEFSQQYSQQDLVKEIEGMTRYVLDILSNASNDDVIFVPVDEDANDTYADNPDEINIAWTLGHVVVHMTASMEESAFIAAELARGVAVESRRSRVEVNWETVTTIKQCRERVEESHRMILGSLAIWPNEPNLNNSYIGYQQATITTRRRFLGGLIHADSHYEQMKEIIRQSRNARKLA